MRAYTTLPVSQLGPCRAGADVQCLRGIDGRGGGELLGHVAVRATLDHPAHVPPFQQRLYPLIAVAVPAVGDHFGCVFSASGHQKLLWIAKRLVFQFASIRITLVKNI